MVRLAISLASALVSVFLLFASVTIDEYLVIFIIGVLMFLFSGALFALHIKGIVKNKINRLKNRLEMWTNISPHISKAGDEAFKNLPIGIVVYDRDYTILWANDFIKNALKANLLDSHVDIMRDELSLTLKNKIATFPIISEERTFDVIHNFNNRILYFFDQTEKAELSKKYSDKTTAIAIIGIDNLDEALKKFDVYEAARIRGLIHEAVSDWASEHQVFQESHDNERITMIFNKKTLMKMMEGNFDVLTKVKELATKYLIRVSVSIGIACYDVTYEELGNLANNAIELAEKRGGDQVVVNIEGQNIKFYGGLSEALEKNTLMQARISASELRDIVEKASNVYITTHNLADCDALGSSLGMMKMLQTTTDEVKIVFDPKLSDIAVQRFFNEMSEIQPKLLNSFIKPDEMAINDKTILIVLDTQSPSMLMYPEMLDNIKNVVVIDHHRMGERPFSSPVLQYIEPYASSTVELVAEMMMFYDNDIRLTPFEASILLSGIVVDTNNFKFRTGSRTFEVAALLKTKGADANIVKTFLRDDFQIEQELATATLNAKIHLENFAIYACNEDKYFTDRTILSRISDRMLEIANVSASFTIAKVSNEDIVAISARSIQKTNVQIIMEEMGGGGHFNSAATQIKGKTVKEVRKELLEILQREFGHAGDEMMKVILIQDVKGKGKKDDIVDVAVGYANYLFTNNLAVVADKDNLRTLETQKQELIQEAVRFKQLMLKLKKDIEANEVDIHVKLGPEQKVLGNITTKQIAEEFQNQNGILIDKRKIDMPIKINSVGVYMATVVLHEDIAANIKINVLEK